MSDATRLAMIDPESIRSRLVITLEQLAAGNVDRAIDVLEAVLSDLERRRRPLE